MKRLLQQVRFEPAMIAALFVLVAASLVLNFILLHRLHA